MRCLVTGATGHIGSHVVRYLLSQDVEVMALVRPTTNNIWRIEEISHRLRIIKEDLLTIENSYKEIRQFAPEIMIHSAWYGVGSGYRDDPAQVTQNFQGSLKLLELAHRVGCKRWIGLGSQAEYGPYNGILTEDMPTRAHTIYGVTKLCSGLMSQKLCEAYRIGFVWLRLTAAYGPMDDPNHLIPHVILNLLQGKKPSLTLGEQRWDYLYVEDVARAIWQVATIYSAQGIFNLGSGEAHTVRSIVELIHDLINPKLPLGFGEISYPPDQIMHLQVDISRLQQATGWFPQVDLHEGLRRTAEWFRENRSEAEYGG